MVDPISSRLPRTPLLNAPPLAHPTPCHQLPLLCWTVPTSQQIHWDFSRLKMEQNTTLFTSHSLLGPALVPTLHHVNPLKGFCTCSPVFLSHSHILKIFCSKMGLTRTLPRSHCKGENKMARVKMLVLINSQQIGDFITGFPLWQPGGFSGSLKATLGPYVGGLGG